MRYRLLTAALLLAGSAQATVVDAVVATVGDQVILHSDLLAEAGPLLQEMRETAGSQEAFDRGADGALKEALNLAIERKLLFRQAQLAGIEISDGEIEDRLTSIRREYGTQEEFQRILEEAGLTISEFRVQLREQLMALSMGHQKREQLKREAVVTEEDMLRHYEDHHQDFSNPERVQVRRIFIGAQSPEDRAAARARIEGLRQQLLEGADFAALAQEHSQGPDATSGGLVGWVARGDLVDPLETAAFTLSPGMVSEVLETEFGYHLLRVEERTEAGAADYDEVRTKIEPLLRERYAEQRYQRWIDELRKRSQVIVHL